MPSGLVGRPKVRSVSEAVSLDAHDRIISVAKNALQTYIASFMDTNGANRSYIRALSPQALQYVTDKSLQDTSGTDNRKPTQLAVLFNQIRQRIPAIMIIDSGVTWEEPGLGGGLERVSMVGGEWQGWFRVLARVNVIVAAVTEDPESCSMLQTILSMFFKQLRVEAGGSRMHSERPGDNWEVRLPLNFTSSAPNPTNVEGDPVHQIYASTIELELQAEDIFAVSKPIQRFQIEEGVANESNLAGRYPPIIDVPDSVRLRDGPFMAFITQLGDQHKIVIDTPTVATIDVDTKTITPHRLGTFKVMVVDPSRQSGEFPVLWSAITVAEKTVTVTL